MSFHMQAIEIIELVVLAATLVFILGLAALYLYALIKEVNKMEYIDKEVHFDQYCKKCKHKDKKESEDPCYKCLENPVNAWSHKPTKFEEAENK